MFRYKKDNINNEIVSIGLMRGIASLMVCYFHLTNGDSDYLPNSSIIKKSGEWGWSGVEVFFIISGFVIPYSMFVKNYSFKNLGTFLKKRIVRIEPPYLVSIVMVLIMGYISSRMPFYRGHPFHIDWWNVAGHVAYLNVFTGAKWLQDVYWTLAIEFQYYILIAVVYGLLISKNIYLRLLFFILFMASFWLRPFLPSSTYIFSFAPYFILGILLFQYYCSIISSIESWLLLLLTVGVLYSYDGPVLTSIAVITIVLIAFVKKVHPVFIFLGAISYSLYLVHIPMGGRFISIAVRLLPASVHTKEALVFAALGFCLLTAWVYYTLIEKRFKLLASKIGYTEKIVPAPVLNNADLISKT